MANVLVNMKNPSKGSTSPLSLFPVETTSLTSVAPKIMKLTGDALGAYLDKINTPTLVIEMLEYAMQTINFLYLVCDNLLDELNKMLESQQNSQNLKNDSTQKNILNLFNTTSKKEINEKEKNEKNR